MTFSVVVCGLANLLLYWQEDAAFRVFTTDPEVMRYASIRFHTVLLFQALASSYEISGSYMRGLGYSVIPMLLTIFGNARLRGSVTSSLGKPMTVSLQIPCQNTANMSSPCTVIITRRHKAILDFLSSL